MIDVHNTMHATYDIKSFRKWLGANSKIKVATQIKKQNVIAIKPLNCVLESAGQENPFKSKLSESLWRKNQ